jgi:hypothetical protein
MDASVLATGADGDLRSIDEELGRVHFSVSRAIKAGRPAQAVSTAVLNVLQAVGFARWLLKFRYVMPPAMISMIGVKTRGE